MLLAHQPNPESTRIGDAASLVAMLGSSWAITEQGRQQVLALVTRSLQGKESLPLRAGRTATIRDGVAIIPVSGPLYSREDDFTRWCGITTYESILRDFNAALEDKSVKAIVFDVDSPGGLTAGCQELAAAVFAARGKKPIIAYVGGMCASAAYWVASAADRIIATPTALVGSIGCFTTLVDDSELMAKIGIKVYDVANDQSPFKVPDASKAADRDRVRAMVTQLAGVFIGAVAKHRGVSEDRVEAKFGRGDVLVAASALSVGMIDALGDFESLVTGLAKTPDAASGVESRAPRSPVAVTRPPKNSRSSSSVRAEQKGKRNMADLEKLKEHAEKIHDAAKGADDGESAAKAMAPHCKALHEEMGEHSPFYDDGDDDEDDKEAKSFVRSLGGVKALKGALAASDKIAGRVADLEKQVAQANAEKAQTELKALLDEATVDGRIAPADRAEMEKMHAEHGMPAVRACISRLPKKPQAAVEPATPPAAAPGASAPNSAQVQAAVASLTPAEMAMCKRRNQKPEEFAAYKAQYMAALKSQATQDKE